MNYTAEEIAELLKERPNQPHYIAAMVKKAVLSEREECALLCEKIDAFDMDDPGQTCADEIRNRHNTGVSRRA